MARPDTRITALQVALGLGIVAIVGRAAQLQLIDGGQWRSTAEKQRTEAVELPARRGTLRDRKGRPLALTQEFYRLGIAPKEVTERAALARATARVTRQPVRAVDRALGGTRYVYYHGPFTATEVQPLRAFHGVHLELAYQRAYPLGVVGAPIIGRLSPERDVGNSGLELALDSLLRGVPGRATYLRDRAGQRFESPSRREREPAPGHDITLTLDADLQEIAEQALDATLKQFGARSGDVVFLDVRTGELLAVASRQQDAGASASAFNGTFEPGSTAKLFTAAALLMQPQFDTTETVSGECGTWKMPMPRGKVRVITDAHKECRRLSLGEAIKVSSNIAMAKFAAHLDPGDQWAMHRAFGFGTPTGVEFPVEASGRLLRPGDPRFPYIRESRAMGYEFSVTALQLATAYAAIANGGMLMTPALVKEIRSADGRQVYQHQPEPVRRAIPERVALTLQEYLRRVTSEGGTADKLGKGITAMAGKTGTARLAGRRGYEDGKYTASFAALFPAEKPRLVAVVKIDEPSVGAYYGGLVAAPTAKKMLDDALASGAIGFDDVGLVVKPAGGLAAQSPAPRASAETSTAAASRQGEPAERPESTAVVLLPLRPRATVASAPVTVPGLAGQSLRQAAYALHRRGLAVNVHGAGRVARSEPGAGAQVIPGTTVDLYATP